MTLFSFFPISTHKIQTPQLQMGKIQNRLHEKNPNSPQLHMGKFKLSTYIWGKSKFSTYIWGKFKIEEEIKNRPAIYGENSK